MLVLMLLQTVIEVAYFLLLKFIEKCNRLLPGRAADSTICMGICMHCTCLSRMPPGEMSANAWKRTMAT